MPLHADIYDGPSGRDSLSVWPSMAQRVVVLNVDGPFERKPGEYAVILRPGYGGRGTCVAVPVDAEGKQIPGTMKGYSYISTSDSRFREAIEKITGSAFYGAVALHDRLENQCRKCNSYTPLWRMNAGHCLECAAGADGPDPLEAVLAGEPGK